MSCYYLHTQLSHLHLQAWYLHVLIKLVYGFRLFVFFKTQGPRFFKF